jgi:hypothetical protein
MGQEIRSSAKVTPVSPPRSGATIVFTSLGRHRVVSRTLTECVNFSLTSTLSTYMPVFAVTTRWHGSPDLGFLEPPAGSRPEARCSISYCSTPCRAIRDPGAAISGHGDMPQPEQTTNSGISYPVRFISPIFRQTTQAKLSHIERTAPSRGHYPGHKAPVRADTHGAALPEPLGLCDL